MGVIDTIKLIKQCRVEVVSKMSEEDKEIKEALEGLYEINADEE